MVPQNRISCVTGAARGLGLAFALALLKLGNRVVATDRDMVDTAHFPAELRDRLMVEKLDVTDREQARSLFATVKKEWGLVGILVNNAGVSYKLPDRTSAMATTVSDEEWEKTFAINLTSILHITQIALPHMQELGWGRIVNIASLAGRTISRVSGAAYSSSKAGVIGITRVMANEFGPMGITANCIAPGRVATPMAMQGGPEVNKAYAEQIPVRRIGNPEDVAVAVTFLASEEASFINGAVIDVNGGYFMP